MVLQEWPQSWQILELMLANQPSELELEEEQDPAELASQLVPLQTLQPLLQPINQHMSIFGNKFY